MVQYSGLDLSFSALADSTRRGVLEQLGNGPATISELAVRFGMTLTGMKKHVLLLERAGMVVTEKRGRVRYCHRGDNVLENEMGWLRRHQLIVDQRTDRS